MRNKSARRSKNPKKQSRLGHSLDLRLKDYSLAAAGIGALTLASPAQATIATVSPNLTITSATHFELLPIPGFPAVELGVFDSGAFAGLSGSSGISLLGNEAGLDSALAPVAFGAQIPGTLLNFHHDAGLAATGDTNFSGTGFKYVGFSIGTGAAIHYGWINLTISGAPGSFVVVVNSIAVEQCAAQPISAGQAVGGANCSGVPATPAPNSLFLLSLGVAGLAGLETLRRLRRAAS